MIACQAPLAYFKRRFWLRVLSVVLTIPAGYDLGASTNNLQRAYDIAKPLETQLEKVTYFMILQLIHNGTQRQKDRLSR